MVHWDNFFLDVKVEITTQLISRIIGFPIKGEDPKWLFAKESEKILTLELYEKYQTTRGTRYIVIRQINDDTIKFFANLMTCKLLRKCKKDQCFASVLKVVEICVVGVQMSWEPFLLNQFILDCQEAQQRGIEFQYNWFLILITMEAWKSPVYHSQFLPMRDPDFVAPRYGELWHTPKNKN